MDIVIKLSQFLLSLSLLIILHELGHFIPAKLFKTRVEKFYLFFDVKFSLFKKQIGETVYGIGWLPLGGYVKISGMIDESMDKEQMALPPQPWEFRSKPAWQRLIIMLGGVTVNFILAFIIYIGMTWYYGDSFIANDSLKDGVWVISKGLTDVGIKSGDKIVSIDGEKLNRFDEAQGKLITAKKITVNRNGIDKEIMLPVDLAHKIIEEKQKILFFPRIPFIAGGFEESSANKNILKKGDFIISINNRNIQYYDQASEIIKQYANQTVSAVIKRNDKLQTVTIKVNNKGKIGVAPAMVSSVDGEKLGLYKLTTINHSLTESVPIGFQMGVNKVSDYWKQLKLIANPDTGAYKGVGGFAAIYNVFPDSWSWEVFWSITAFLSIMLGVMNLLPIPALDGGHVMFLLYEIISGKKPSDKFLENAQMVGFVLLISLLLFANGNDIYKAIVK